MKIGTSPEMTCSTDSPGRTATAGGGPVRAIGMHHGPAHRPFHPSLPLLLLLLALSTVFLFGNDRGQFYRSPHHNGVSANHLAVAANLSAEHDFLLFYHQTLDQDGTPYYAPYNRFPLGGYALIKLAILPFDNDFSAQLHAARVMFLLFFAGSAVLAYLSLRRLTANRWIALTASLLAFSSYYLLYYNDMTATENGLSLFGALLTFHGMVLFVQEGRFRQLLVKACAALLLGWHVYAFLLPFIVLGMANELNRARRLSAPPSLAGRIKRGVVALLSSRHLRLGVVTLLFGMAVLSFNLGNEYRALDGEVALTELPTAKSMTYRFGADDRFNERWAEALAWGNFLENQFYRVARATLPFAISPFDNEAIHEDKDYLGVIVGALASGVAVIGLLFARQRMLLASLVLSGFCWALPMRHNTAFAYHEFESVFYVGVPLVLFSIGLSGLRRLFGGRLLVGLSAAALLVFVLSSFQMGRVGHDQKMSEIQEVIVADFERIRTIVGAGQSVFSPISQRVFAWVWGGIDGVKYYLAGRVIGRSWPNIPAYDFLISHYRIDIPALLTPDNGRIFLYRRNGYSAQIEEMIGKSELAVRRDGYSDVYRSGNSLIYVGHHGWGGAAQFIEQDFPTVGKPFHVMLYPSVRRAGFTDRSRWRWERGGDAAGYTDVPGSPPSPTYVYTPTSADEGQRLRAHVYYTDSHGNRVKATTAPSLPVQPSGTVGVRFFLHLYPVDVGDLPDHRKRHGFDNLDFRFGEYALPLTERRVAMHELPDYAIARVRTGQFRINEDGSFTQLWEGEVRFNE